MTSSEFHLKFNSTDEIINHITELENRNDEMSLTNYVMLVIIILTCFIALHFFDLSTQYEKDIVMIVKDVADRQAQIDELKRDRTCLPRINKFDQELGLL